MQFTYSAYVHILEWLFKQWQCLSSGRMLHGSIFCLNHFLFCPLPWPSIQQKPFSKIVPPQFPTSKLKRKFPLPCQSISEEQPCEPVAVSGLPDYPGGNSSAPSAPALGPSAHMQQRCHSAHLYSPDPYSQQYLLSTGCQCSFSTNCSGPSYWPAAKLNSLKIPTTLEDGHQALSSFRDEELRDKDSRYCAQCLRANKKQLWDENSGSYQWMVTI